MSFCCARASATMRPALSWAALTVWLAHTPRMTKPTATPMTPATMAAAATSNPFHIRILPRGRVNGPRVFDESIGPRSTGASLGSGPGSHSARSGLSRWLRLARGGPQVRARCP